VAGLAQTPCAAFSCRIMKLCPVEEEYLNEEDLHQHCILGDLQGID